MNSSSGDYSSSLMTGTVVSYVNTISCYMRDIYSFFLSASSSPSSAPTEDNISLLSSSEASSRCFSKSERTISNDTPNHSPCRRTPSCAKHSPSSTGSSCPSSTGSATGSASDHSPMLHSSRRRLFGQEIKAENSLKSPPGKILFEQKKDL